MKTFLFIPLILIAHMIHGQCMVQRLASPGQNWESEFKQFETTGNRSLDKFFVRQIHLALVVFSLNAVDMYFYDDRNDHNAVAIYSAGLDVVSFGLGIIESKRREFALHPDQPCAALVAHEMGHIKQYSRGKLADLKTFQKELHADFLAGYFMGYKWRIELATKAEAESFFNLFFSIGDNAFNSSTHHGTPTQRRRAAMIGWEYGKLLRPIDEVYDEGIRIVSQFQINDGN